MVRASVLGYPRIGLNRELKKATEAHWAGKLSEEELLKTGAELRARHWKIQTDAGLDYVPTNDFSYYDHVLDHSVLFNVIPDRYQGHGLGPLATYFAMARGLQRPATDSTPAVDVTSQEMVKWFDSNYHYMRPELSNNTEFKLTSSRPVDEFNEAKAAGVKNPRPVILGPVSFLHLGKAAHDSQGLDTIDLLNKLLPVYVELLEQLGKAGAEWVQIDEPVLVYELSEKVQAAFKPAYEALAKAQGRPKVLLASYFGELGPNASTVFQLPVDGIHVDLVRAPQQLDSVVSSLKPEQTISLGLVDGRNIWIADLNAAISTVSSVVAKVGADRVFVATSSSLLHTPNSVSAESKISDEIKQWLAFAQEKVREVVVIATAAKSGSETVKEEIEKNVKALEARASSKLTNVAEVRQRVASATPEISRRKSPFSIRCEEQKKKLNLPIFPTTTIGSYPQTKEIRQNRLKFTKGEISEKEYDAFINKEIELVIEFQEKVGLDVLVHGEPERNDMVQYFGERMSGFAFTSNGWVQSYGSRYVRPPIIVGDVSRPHAMTVKESTYAQSITKKPVKGMLTGPVTCLRWSFPRNDLSLSEQCKQLAFALRDEVVDLEKAGIYVIQVDEPGIREGCPLRKTDWPAYLDYAVESFKITTSGVTDATQIHSHFCYSDFNEIFQALKDLDADVISIEASKSDLKLLNVFERENYSSGIGPGLYDIHSPRVPPQSEFEEKIRDILKYLPPANLWINPDCGLKTRQWPEVEAALTNMVQATIKIRAEYEK